MRETKKGEKKNPQLLFFIEKYNLTQADVINTILEVSVQIDDKGNGKSYSEVWRYVVGEVEMSPDLQIHSAVKIAELIVKSSKWKEDEKNSVMFSASNIACMLCCVPWAFNSSYVSKEVGEFSYKFLGGNLPSREVRRQYKNIGIGICFETNIQAQDFFNHNGFKSSLDIIKSEFKKIFFKLDKVNAYIILKNFELFSKTDYFSFVYLACFTINFRPKYLHMLCQKTIADSPDQQQRENNSFKSDSFDKTKWLEIAVKIYNPNGTYTAENCWDRIERIINGEGNRKTPLTNYQLMVAILLSMMYLLSEFPKEAILLTDYYTHKPDKYLARSIRHLKRECSDPEKAYSSVEKAVKVKERMENLFPDKTKKQPPQDEATATEEKRLELALLCRSGL